MAELNHFSTPVRVLLDRARGTFAVDILRAASVRINGRLQAAKLLTGPLIIQKLDEYSLEMIRIPFAPLVAQDFILQWAEPDVGFQIAERRYRGSLRLRMAAGEAIAINTLPMQEYLASTVGGEMSPSWPLEALKAQSVAARSYTVARLRKPRDRYFDLEDTTEDQVYRGVETETLSVWDAVKGTSGIVLTRKGAPVTAYYHARCGGETLPAEQAWGGKRAPTARVPCAFCRKNPMQWDAQWDAKSFASTLGLPARGDLSIRPVSRNPAGRVLELEVAAGNQRRLITAERLRREIGYQKIKSTHFDFTVDGQEVRATGFGFGHGVGMCQWGAKHLAQRGYNFQAILTHYYPREKAVRWTPPQISLDSPRFAGIGSLHDRPAALRLPFARRADRALSSRTP